MSIQEEKSNEVIGKGNVDTETTSTSENTNNQTQDKELRQVPINSLVIPTCHPRKYSGDLPELKESIRRDGVQEPLSVDEKEDGSLLVVVHNPV